MKSTLFTLLALPFLLFSQTEKGVKPITNNQSTNNQTRAVVIGISDYQEKDIPDLRFADKDALAFANFLRSPAGGSLDNDHLKVLTNENATAGQFAAALDWLIEQSKEGDEAIIYFSGHGDVERNTISQPGFLLCWDAPGRVYMGGGTYSLVFLQEIVQTLSNQNKAKVVVVTDACHAGKLAGSQIGGAQLTAANAAKQFSSEAKILSCQPNEFSLEGEQWGGGRGVFSYHFVDGLFGLADRNGDGGISLFEIGRYLEDNVTAEASPQSQIPMVLGNKTERLATVNPAILAALQKSKASGMPVFAATEGRGFEDDVLAKADSSIRQQYLAFQKAVREKRFFPEASVGVTSSHADTKPCADELYAQLAGNESLAPLRGFMKRQYAAALQDDAQQAMNIWLKADVQQLECIGKSLRLEPIPRQLGRAAELLGEGHYMHRSLQARRLLFEGILGMKHKNPDEILGRSLLSLFQQSLALEPQSPLSWHRMSMVYTTNLRKPDSAFVYARRATELAPNWVLPLSDLGYELSKQHKQEMAKQALDEAEAIDPLHPYVINRKANWLLIQAGKDNLEKALYFFEKYRESGGPMYPCWHNDYGMLLKGLGKYEAAEREFKAGIALDSTTNSLWSNTALLYVQTRRPDEAEKIFKKNIALDSTDASSWTALGIFYMQVHRYPEAESAMKRAIALDSTGRAAWSNLGAMYIQTSRFDEAEAVLKKAIAIDSTTIQIWGHLGRLYFQTRRFAEAESAMKRGIALDTTNITEWNNLAAVYFSTRRYAEVEPVFKKILAIDSTQSTFWSNLGVTYLQTRRYAEAEPVFKKAIALDSAFAAPRRHLGMVFFRTNRPELARQNFLKALELNPNHAGAMLGMACLFFSENKTAEALEQVEQAILKKATFEQLESDEDLAPLRALPEWKALMKKHFPDKVKD